MPKLGPTCLNKRTRIGGLWDRASRKHSAFSRRWRIFREILVLGSVAFPGHVAILLPMCTLEVLGLIFPNKRTLFWRKTQRIKWKGDKIKERQLQEEELLQPWFYSIISEDQGSHSPAQSQGSVNVCWPVSEKSPYYLFGCSLLLYLSHSIFFSTYNLPPDTNFRWMQWWSLTLVVSSPRKKGHISSLLFCF